MFQKQDDIRVNDPLDPGRNNVRLKLPGCFVIYAAEINGVTEFGITRCVLRVAGCGSPGFHCLLTVLNLKYQLN
jgi:hypothetical protein